MTAKSSKPLKEIVIEALDGLKAQDIVCFDVAHLTSITDQIIICTGTSTRHVKALAQRVAEKALEETGVKPLGIEGEQQSEWILVDLNEVLIHIMTDHVRSFYQLEKLWGIR